MDKTSLDRYLTSEPDNGYHVWLEKVWDNIPETEISPDEYVQRESFFDELALTLTKGLLPSVKFATDVIIRRFKAYKENLLK